MPIVFDIKTGVADSMFGKSQDPIKMLIMERAEAMKAGSVYDKIFKKINSDQFGEKMTSMTSMDSFQPVGNGGAYPALSTEEGFAKTIEAETYKGKFVITQEAVEDNKVGMDGKPQQMVTAYYRAREELGAGLLVAAAKGEKAFKIGTRAYSTESADGSLLFAQDHKPKVSGGKQTNKYQGAFSAENLSKAETAMQNMLDDNGHILSIRPNTILIPNDGELKREVLAVIGADKDPDVQAGNGYNIHHGRWNVIINPYMNALIGTGGSGGTPWFLMDTDYNETYGGLCRIERIPLTFTSWVDNNNDNNVWNGRARFNAGFVDFRAILMAGASAGGTL